MSRELREDEFSKLWVQDKTLSGAEFWLVLVSLKELPVRPRIVDEEAQGGSIKLRWHMVYGTKANQNVERP